MPPPQRLEPLSQLLRSDGRTWGAAGAVLRAGGGSPAWSNHPKLQFLGKELFTNYFAKERDMQQRFLEYGFV